MIDEILCIKGVAFGVNSVEYGIVSGGGSSILNSGHINEIETEVVSKTKFWIKHEDGMESHHEMRMPVANGQKITLFQFKHLKIDIAAFNHSSMLMYRELDVTNNKVSKVFGHIMCAITLLTVLGNISHGNTKLGVFFGIFGGFGTLILYLISKPDETIEKYKLIYNQIDGLIDDELNKKRV